MSTKTPKSTDSQTRPHQLPDTYGHTPARKAFQEADVYGIGFDAERASRPLIRLGICGTGGVAQSKYLPAIQRLRTLWEPVEIAAIAEPRRDQADKVAALIGCLHYTRWQDMLADEPLDGILVTAPDDLHVEVGLAAIEAGRGVLVEKPIGRSLVAAEQLCRTADHHDQILMTVANKRYSPPYRRAKQFIAQGPVTNPALFTGKFNLGYDYVDMFEGGTIHLFDLARYLMGDVTTVRAVGVNKYQRNRQGYPFDNATCQFEFASGAVGMVYTSTSALSFKPWERVEVYGDHAWLCVEDQSELILYDSEEGPAKSWSPVVPHTLLFDEEFAGFMGVIEDFCQALRRVSAPVVTGWDGYHAYELNVAAHLSMARSGEVISLPLEAAQADAECAVWLQQHRRP